MDKPVHEYKYVSFASAGTRGLVYFGVLDALEDHLEEREGVSYETWRQSLRGAAGTSAGAIAALLLLLGNDRKARQDMFREMADIRNVMRQPDVSLLVRRYGMENGAGLRELLQRALMRGGLSATSTLGDVRRLLRQDLVCICTDLRSGKPMILSAQTTPQLQVCDAVYASCCVPFLFVPTRINDVLVVDGCLTCNLPQVFDDDETLFVKVAGANESSDAIESWSDFLHGIVRCASVMQEKRLDPLPMLTLHLPRSLADSPSFDVHMTVHDADLLFRAGYASTLDRVAQRVPSKVAAQSVMQLLAAVPAIVSTDETIPPSADAPDSADAPIAC